ncbi:MAG: CDP-archaeol synthase [Clostridia bacterium]|nr:CDP-archaeol synthase [Clostridia bacterium]
MKQRIISALIFIAIMLTMVLLCDETRLLFFIICTLLSCREMKNAFRNTGHNVMIWYVYVTGVVCSALIYIGDGKEGWAFPVFMIMLVCVFGEMILANRHTVRDVLATLCVCAYPMSPLMLVVYVASNQYLWAAVMLNSILPAVVCDTFALLGGKLFGKHKLSPHISPKKTVEGLVCGLIMGTVSGLLVHVILKPFGRNVLPIWAEVTAALFASLAGALGDLAASSIKRECGIKDYSNLIPGHGGMLDRIDSELFAIPTVYMIYAIVQEFTKI